MKYVKPFNCVQKKLAQVRFKMLSTKCVYIIYLISMYKKA